MKKIMEALKEANRELLSLPLSSFEEGEVSELLTNFLKIRQWEPEYCLPLIDPDMQDAVLRFSLSDALINIEATINNVVEMLVGCLESKDSTNIEFLMYWGWVDEVFLILQEDISKNGNLVSVENAYELGHKLKYKLSQLSGWRVDRFKPALQRWAKHQESRHVAFERVISHILN